MRNGGGGGGGGAVPPQRKNQPEESSGIERDEIIDRKRLGDLIQKATTSPLLQLDDAALSSIKGLVRVSDSNVQAAFDFLLDRLKKNHSQVRYLAVLIMDELFTRSKFFRSLLVPKFETFMLLSIGTRADYPLPPPEDRADLLRKKALEVIEKWKDMFGQHYKPIRLAYDYLKSTLRLEFPNAREVATLASQQRREREERTQALLKKKYQTLKEEFPSLKVEVQATLEEIDACLQILIPPGSGNEGDTLVDDGDDEEFEEYGVESLRHLRDTVEEQDTIPSESGDNSAIYDSMRDLYKLLTTRHLINAQEWLTTLMRVDPEDDRQSRDALLRDIIDLRNNLLVIRAKCEGLGIQRIEGSRNVAVGEEDDVEWEQGDILISDTAVADNAVVKPASEYNGRQKSEEAVGKKGKANGREAERTDIKSELLKEAPVLPWGSFLDTWGSQSAVPANPRGLEFENHWGKVDYDVMIPADKIAEISIRASYYKPPEVEIRPCLAPLRKGGLCKRRDLRRCPLHGPVIPRDENGNPIPEEQVDAESPGKHASEADPKDVTGEPSIVEEGNEVGSVLDRVATEHLSIAEQAVRNVRREQASALARKQRAKRTREHNEACLRDAAMSSARLGFGDTTLDEGSMTNLPAKKSRGGLTALLRKKPTSKDRLARRLLNGRVRDATIDQLSRDEQAAYRESFPNQW